MTPDDTTLTNAHTADDEDITERLRELLAQGEADALADFVDTLEAADVRRSMAHLSEEDQARIVSLLDPEDAADLIDDLPDEHAADVLEDIPPIQAAAIVEELDSGDRADVLGEMEDEDAQAILDALPIEEAEEARQLLAYPEDTAGGVMIKEFVAYTAGTTVGEVLEDLQRRRDEYSHYDVRYFYVVDASGALKGVLRLRDLILSPPDRPIEDVMIREPDVARTDMPLTTLQQAFEVHSYSALPVVDPRGQLLGVVIEKEVAGAARKNANRTLLKLAGILGGEELRSMELSARVWGRLRWLIIIMGLSLVSASVIKFFETTLERAIGLAMFLPIVSNMIGCSGNQAVALSMREMALGVVNPWDLTYVLFKEVAVGVVNGIVLGALLSVIGTFATGDYRLGIIVGIALSANTVVSVTLGGTLPLMLKRINIDPATASSPMLTTVLDFGGFFLVLGLASLMLSSQASALPMRQRARKTAQGPGRGSTVRDSSMCAIRLGHTNAIPSMITPLDEGRAVERLREALGSRRDPHANDPSAG